MCTVAAVPIAIAAVGTAASVYSQYQKGKYDSEVASNNARIAGYHRADAKQQGALASGDIMAEANSTAASARAAVTANGVDPYSGSMADVIAGSGAIAAADSVRAKANAARAAWGFTNEQQDLGAQARMAKRAGYLGAFGAGVSGVGNAASIYAGSKGPTYGND